LVRISLIFALGGAAVLAAQETSATLSGEIHDVAGASIPSINVELRLAEPPYTIFSLRTDGAGAFKFTVLPTGTYTLLADKPGFQTLRLTSMQLASGEHGILPPLRLDIGGSCGAGPPTIGHLQRLPGSGQIGNLSGTVMRDQAHPITRATVKLRCGQQKVCGDTKTDSKGEFIFFNLSPRDDNTIRVTHPGFYPWEGSGYEVRVGFDSTYGPITLDRRLRTKRPLVVCE
jgi:hypothetical protein